ncbi:MAG: DUF3460 family protein [Azoarcus sp.]|nr:DUF3460 family protein [Azoarcus sp.]
MPKPYESEFTLFMREWLAQHPEECDVRRAGLALWWDKPQNVRARRTYDAARVPVRPYYYDTAH